MKLNSTSCNSTQAICLILSVTLIGLWPKPAKSDISHSKNLYLQSIERSRPKQSSKQTSWLTTKVGLEARSGHQETVTKETPVRDELVRFMGHSHSNVTELLINRFQYLFADLSHLKQTNEQAGLNYDRQTQTTEYHKQPQQVSSSKGIAPEISMADSSSLRQQDNDGSLQSILETRKIEQEAQLTTNGQFSIGQQNNADCEYLSRNYFKILNRVFSRVELPEVFKTSRLVGGHCGLHIGCVEEIPNFPSLLKKANVSSTFTIYTRPAGNPEAKLEAHKIPFEPIVHHQLHDLNVSNDLSILKEHIKDNLLPTGGVKLQRQAAGNKRKTASSWRSAARIAHSQEYPFDLAALEQSGFNASANTRIIVGVYFAKDDEEWIDEVVRQWSLLEPQGNIVKVGWAAANRGLYHTAAYNSRIVGRQLTLFLHYLDQLFNIDLNKFHLVGHSLGAHIAGFAGADNEGRVARITGLDPAGPIFVELNTSMRLDPSDAQFVDVLHTNGGTITKGALGLSIPSGHADYYCNGGSAQPGCYFSSVTRSIIDPVERVACNHRRSYRYFIEITKMAINELAGHQQSSVTSNSTVGAGNRREGGAEGAESRSVDINTDGSDTSHQSVLSHMPTAFLFEAKQDDLVKLVQPEIVLMSNQLARRDVSDMAPLKRRLEFHLLKPDFPVGKRGLYYFKTRSESPYFATKQYALVLKTDTLIRRKIAITAKIDMTLVAEAELDEIPGIFTLAFAPNDQRLINLGDPNRPPPQLSIMWKYRSFNLLLNQQNELHFSSIELSSLDSDNDEQELVRFSQVSNQLTFVNNPMRSLASQTDLTLTRNQWHRFEGRVTKVKANTVK